MNHVSRAGTPRDEAGPLVDAGIPDPPCCLIVFVLRQDHASGKAFPKCRNSLGVDGSAVAPSQLGSFHCFPHQTGSRMSAPSGSLVTRSYQPRCVLIADV